MQEAVDSKGRMLVEVSTKGSKCYIGFAQEGAVAATSESDIAIGHGHHRGEGARTPRRSSQAQG